MATTTKASSRKPSRSVLQALVTAMIAGLQNDLPTGTKSLLLEGQSMTPTQVIAQFQVWLTAVASVVTAKAAYAKAVADCKTAEAPIRPLARALTAWLKVQFGSTNAAELANFGLTVTPAKVPSAATKAVATAKRAASLEKKKAAAAAAIPTTTLVVGANGAQLAPTASAPAAPASPPGTAAP